MSPRAKTAPAAKGSPTKTKKGAASATATRARGAKGPKLPGPAPVQIDQSAKRVRGGRHAPPELSSSTRPVGRYSLIYDIDGPRVRMALVWGAGLVVAMVAGLPGLGVVFGAVGAVAGLQTAAAWRRFSKQRPNAYVAAVMAGLLPVASVFGLGVAGLACLAGAGVSVAAAFATPSVDAKGRHRARTTSQRLADLGVGVQCWLIPGLAAASPVLIGRIELGATFALLVVLCAYDVGDFVVGTGANTVVEGPFAGLVSAAVLTWSLYVLDGMINLPPFGESSIAIFGAFAALLAPLGQITASGLLPRADARAPALRRLDTLLVAGPVWLLGLWAYTGW